MDPETLDCQICGNVLKELSNAEAQQVARNPYNFVVYCSSCKKDISNEASQAVQGK